MNDNTSLVLTTAILASTIIMLSVGGWIYGYSVDKQIAEAIKAGGDPIAVSCALDFGASRASICAIKAAAK